MGDCERESDEGTDEEEPDDEWFDDEDDDEETDECADDEEGDDKIEASSVEVKAETRNKPKDPLVEKAKELASNSPNLWKDPNVPKTGWNCVDVTDLGGPYGICEMCGYQIIRYAHRMKHPHYRSLV